jgi:Rieske 2Fe-2S family protein
MQARSEMLTTLFGRSPGLSLPRPFYVDPAYLQLDLEHIFYKEWLFAGHSCEVEAPGAYFTLQIGDYPVLVVRGRDGAIRAFHNVCRHRGSRVCTQEHGRQSRLVCPYHQWTYDLDGRLVGARDAMKQIDPAQHGLMPVACGEVAGYVFVSLAEAPRDFAAFRAAVEPYMAPHRLAEARVAHEMTIVERGNWKLVLENNRECYHCARNHPELCRVLSDGPVLSGVGDQSEDAEIAAHWARCEAMGLPSVYRISDSGQHRVVRVPFLGDAVSMTMSGTPAVARPLADFPSAALGTMALFHFPNTWNHMLSDHAISFRVLPLSATETAVTTKWLVHRDAVEGVDYDLKTLTEVWIATNDSDRRIVEENQRGILSPAYRPGPYSEVHEGGVIQFVDWYAHTMMDSLRAGAQGAREVA